MFSDLNFFFSKIVPFSDNVETVVVPGRTQDDNMAHAHFILDN